MPLSLQKLRGFIIAMNELKFEELNLSQEVLRAVSDMGFEQTTPIQSKTIPEIILGKDIVGQASTGTGKTAAFGLPAIEKINGALSAIQILILCPTRELAIQVAAEMNKFLKYKSDISALPIYGGQPIQRQISSLRKLPKIIVGTPGRMLDHIERGNLMLGKVKMVVLDEADEMLDMGFRTDIQKILKYTPNNRQTALFSATMSREVLNLAKTFQNDPKMIRAVGEDFKAKMVEQSYFDVEPSGKTRLLAQLLTEHNPKLSIVFCNTKRKVDKVCRDLRAHGFDSAHIHGDVRQRKRDSIMNRFRKEKVTILVATDVAARGIDVSNIEIVFNYGIPKDCESYVHRIGRTGRAGKTGKAISLVSRTEFRDFRDIMRYTKADIERKQVNNLPDIEFVCRDVKRAGTEKTENKNKLVGRINSRIKRIRKDELSKYVTMMYDFVDDNNSLENVSAALLKMVVEGEDRPKRFPKRFPRRY
jgi:ATP-dependent RNA helicase DeaD